MKPYEHFKKELSEDTPANSMGGGFSVSSASSNPNPNMAGYDPLLFDGKKRKRKKFAGVDVFKITSEDYSKSVNGRKKWSRWNKNMNMEDFDNQEIRTYCHRNPGKSVIIQDENSGVMSYLIPPSRKNTNESVELDEYGVHTQRPGTPESPSGGKYAIKLPKGAEKRSKKQQQVIRAAMLASQTAKKKKDKVDEGSFGPTFKTTGKDNEGKPRRGWSDFAMGKLNKARERGRQADAERKKKYDAMTPAEKEAHDEEEYRDHRDKMQKMSR